MSRHRAHAGKRQRHKVARLSDRATNTSKVLRAAPQRTIGTQVRVYHLTPEEIASRYPKKSDTEYELFKASPVRTNNVHKFKGRDF